MNTNASIAGSRDTNPFHYRRFGSREIKLTRGNQTVVSLVTTNVSRPNMTTMKALKFEDDAPNITPTQCKNHYILVFDLTSTQEAQLQVYCPDAIAASLGVELDFTNALTDTIEVILLGER